MPTQLHNTKPNSNKHPNRIETLNKILTPLNDNPIFNSNSFREDKEKNIQKIIFTSLHQVYFQLLEKLGYDNEECKSITEYNFLFEDKNSKTISNLIFMGTGHRPDLTIKVPVRKTKDYTLSDSKEYVSIGIEIKQGDKGVDVRSGLGQCLVYSYAFDFVVYIFIDKSNDQSILRSYTEIFDSNEIKVPDKDDFNNPTTPEQHLIGSLWENHNCLLVVK